MRRPGRRVVHLLVVVAATLTSVAIAAPANATGISATPTRYVVNGSTVRRPASSVPWAVSLFHGSTAAATPEFRCSGTALGAREILTAAHCVVETGFYYIRVDGNAVDSGRLVAIEAIRSNSGFRLSKWVDDVAVLRTAKPLRLSAYARLAPATMTAAVRSGAQPTVRIYGWGQNERGVVTGQLHTADLVMQARAAATAFGTNFAPDHMLAAGHYRAATRSYSGACSGDSGGPLVVQQNGVPYVVGVTSFGGRDCTSSTPTVFTSVGDYAGWIGRARRALVIRAKR